MQELREKALKRAKLTEDQVLLKIEERTAARKNKEYEKSDAVRKDLAAVGIALMDSPEGTTWRPAVPLELQEQQSAATCTASGITSAVSFSILVLTQHMVNALQEQQTAAT